MWYDGENREEEGTIVLSYDQMGDMLEEIAEQFPEAFYRELDGGIQLERQAMPDPTFPDNDIFIMGQYCHDALGRYIRLYYGSFAILMAEKDEEEWREEIFRTVAHEFTHHMEESAMLHALDDKDEAMVAQLLEKYGGPDEGAR